MLTVLVVAGGLEFNIGNVGGTGLGLQIMIGLDSGLGGAISAVLAITTFLARCAQTVLDRVVIVLGAVILAMAL